jgi:hypothetical protein
VTNNYRLHRNIAEKYRDRLQRIWPNKIVIGSNSGSMRDELADMASVTFDLKHTEFDR